MTRFLMLALLPLVAACDMQSKSAENGDDAVSIRADDSGQIAFNLPVVQGKLKLPAGIMRHGDVDIGGVKLMPGSSVNGFSVDAANDGATVKLAFTSPASPKEVQSYYLDNFEKRGVEAKVEGDAVTGTTEDGHRFAIHVRPAPEGSSGQIDIKADH